MQRLGITSRKALTQAGALAAVCREPCCCSCSSKLQQLLHMRLTCTSASTLAAPLFLCSQHTSSSTRLRMARRCSSGCEPGGPSGCLGRHSVSAWRVLITAHLFPTCAGVTVGTARDPAAWATQAMCVPRMHIYGLLAWGMLAQLAALRHCAASSKLDAITSWPTAACPRPLAQVWLPLLPRINAPGFELVWTEPWSLRAFKGAMWDAAAQQVRFLPGLQQQQVSAAQ